MVNCQPHVEVLASSIDQHVLTLEGPSIVGRSPCLVTRILELVVGFLVEGLACKWLVVELHLVVSLEEVLWHLTWCLYIRSISDW